VISQNHFSHFNKGILEINFFIEMQEESMKVEEEFVIPFKT